MASRYFLMNCLLRLLIAIFTYHQVPLFWQAWHYYFDHIIYHEAIR